MIFIISLIIIFQSIGITLYIKDMFKGKTKPNRVTWFFWALAPLVGVYFQLQSGAGWSVLPVFISGFNPLLVFIFSFLTRNGYWKITYIDVLCGIFAILSLALWIFTRNSSISILFAILSDSFPTVLILTKIWRYPETETSATYWGGLFANTLGLFLIKEWTFTQYSFGVYLTLITATILVLLYRKKIFKIV